MKVKKTELEKKYSSRCCKSEVSVHGEPDFIGSDEVCTHNFVCLNCGKPCDIREKAKLVLHHDDPPCRERLINGYCPECKRTPDMQSTCFYSYCPQCDEMLRDMQCPVCERNFEKGGL